MPKSLLLIFGSHPAKPIANCVGTGHPVEADK
jgi:hypothetical protein